MRSASKKTKKKVATKPRPKPQPKAPKAVVATAGEFDDWAESQKRRSGCATCTDDVVSATIRTLLNAMIRKRAYKITVHEIRRMVEKKHPEVEVGQRGLERHLRTCERDLYFRARGRRNG